MTNRFCLAVILVLVALGFLAPAARADEPPCRDPLPRYAGGSPRVDEFTVDGHRVLVLRPASYTSTGRSYPVLYLLHGGLSTPDEWLERLDVEALTGGLEVIVVMPDGGSGGFYTDWRVDPAGVNRWESFHLGRVVPAIDATYRTHPERAFRAIGGLSMGGFGALRYAARHPDLFAAAGSFSGVLDTNHVGVVRALELTAPALQACYEGRVESLEQRWGPRALDELWWRDSNPTDLAANLRGVDVFTRVGTGAICDTQDVADAAANDVTALTAERDAYEQHQAFVAALEAAGVPSDSVVAACGIHTYRHIGRALQAFLPWVTQRFGTAPPRAFTYRSAAPAAHVWDWTFTPSVTRAPEFLDVRDASERGSS